MESLESSENDKKCALAVSTVWWLPVPWSMVRNGTRSGGETLGSTSMNVILPDELPSTNRHLKCAAAFLSGRTSGGSHSILRSP